LHLKSEKALRSPLKKSKKLVVFKLRDFRIFQKAWAGFEETTFTYSYTVVDCFFYRSAGLFFGYMFLYWKHFSGKKGVENDLQI